MTVQGKTSSGSAATGKDDRVIILGAGQAGAQCAASLRRFGFEGRIMMIGSEPHPPYQRPPLSKAYLSGDIEDDRLWLQSRETWVEQRVDLRLSTTVTRIDRAAKQIRCHDGETHDYTHLVLATGSRVRPLPVKGADLPGVRYLRTIDDVDLLKADFQPGKKIAIIGGGYIGLEAAAVAKKLGAEPIVLEAMDRLLARVAVPQLSEFYLNAHRRRGVTVELGAQVTRLTARRGSRWRGGKRVGCVHLADGRHIDCDSVLVGIGILPNQELAAEAGLEVQNGITVDAECRTSDPAIWAIGDCVEQRNWLSRRRQRLESVPNAIEQGKHAAAAICGAPPPKPEVPWFWSDQFDLKLQTAGLIGDEDTTIVRGDMAADHFTLFHLKDGVLIAADAVCDGHGFMAAKMMIAQGARPDPEALADTSVPIKDTMKAALTAQREMAD
ncbi:NAD(P)/FAD-dependent oxidoreductase [Maricaulis sp. CAU 1757]